MIDIFFAADNRGELWFDGQEVITTETWRETSRVQIPVTPGIHLVAIKAKNDANGREGLTSPEPTDLTHTVASGDTLWAIAGHYYANPTQWPTIYAANQAQIDADAAASGLPYTGQYAGHWIFPGQVLTIPGVPGPGAIQPYYNPAGVLAAVYESTKDGIGRQLTATNSAWRCLPYPVNEPGMTPGEVMTILINEAKNRGCFPMLEIGFGTSRDTSGNPWPRVGDISIRVGDDLLTVLRQLSETYVHFIMSRAGLRLLMYNIDSLAANTVATFTPGVNITELTHEKDL